MDFATLPTLPEAQVIEPYKLHRFFDWMKPPRYQPSAKQRYCVVNGDLVLDSHLHLNWKSVPCNVIVTGNLTVNGSILNPRGGPNLVVLGDAKAWALLTVGANIAIAGTARFSDVVVAQYPEGHLHLGRLETRVMINADHSVTLGGGKYAYFNSRHASYGPSHPETTYHCWSQFLDPALKIDVDDPEGQDCDERNESVDAEKVLLPRFLAGTPVLKAGLPPPVVRD